MEFQSSAQANLIRKLSVRLAAEITRRRNMRADSTTWPAHLHRLASLTFRLAVIHVVISQLCGRLDWPATLPLLLLLLLELARGHS